MTLYFMFRKSFYIKISIKNMVWRCSIVRIVLIQMFLIYLLERLSNQFYCCVIHEFCLQIEPYSPASVIKGMQLGDQVLQINHQDVFTRDQVMRLFSQSVNHIHLLLARSASQQLQVMGFIKWVFKHFQQCKTLTLINNAKLINKLKTNWKMSLD